MIPGGRSFSETSPKQKSNVGPAFCARDIQWNRDGATILNKSKRLGLGFKGHVQSIKADRIQNLP
jgi:hypothetical protein